MLRFRAEIDSAAARKNNNIDNYNAHKDLSRTFFPPVPETAAEIMRTPMQVQLINDIVIFIAISIYHFLRCTDFYQKGTSVSPLQTEFPGWSESQPSMRLPSWSLRPCVSQLMSTQVQNHQRLCGALQAEMVVLRQCSRYTLWKGRCEKSLLNTNCYRLPALLTVLLYFLI